MQPNTSWFVVQTQTGKEELACEHLERQGFTTFFPKLPVSSGSKSTRKKRQQHRSLFPGYVFISFNAENVRWQAINSTIGVIRLVRFGDRPVSLKSGLVERLIELSESGFLSFQEALAPNDKVKILAGPFDDWIGRVVRLPKKDRAMVLLQMSTRSVVVEISKEHLIKAA